MGYKVLVAEGSPIVLKIIVSGYVDAIVGVACLNVLEKAIDKILLAGIPCMAVPLLSSDCRNTSVDEDWVHEMIHVQASAPARNAQLRPLDAALRDCSSRSSDRWPAVGRRSGCRINRSNGSRHDPLAAPRPLLRFPGQGRQAFAAVHHAWRFTTR